jgi:thioredoxin-related protein
MKKKLLALLLLTGLTLSVTAQEKEKIDQKDVPMAVLATFKNEYPEAKDMKWKMKEEKYKVEFEVNGTDHIASFDATGKMLSKGIEIKEAELPAAVTTAIQSGYAGRTIDDAYKVEKDSIIHYLVKLNGNPETKILYSADGQVIKDKK